MDDLLEASADPDFDALLGPEDAEPPPLSETDASALEELRARMREAAQRLEFEKAAGIRDRILAIERRQLGLKTVKAAT